MPASPSETEGANAKAMLFDISGIDLTRTVRTRDELTRWNPHRGDMALLDGIVWESPDHTRCIAVKRVRHDEFWVPGHFPSKPIMPGVLMVEAGAQLACYSWQVRQPTPQLVAFLRIEQALFRNMVEPGDTLYILSQEVTNGRRQFVSDIMGVRGDMSICFETRVKGMAIGPRPEP
ncbi:MAG: hypothetical protein SFZ23_01455 [Planctomycetota bacterium]|nr:hypothetical protein [Planctomycetota bacterium]